jgi:AraC-like DNA-binding protein
MFAGAQECVQFVRPAALPGTELKTIYQSSRRWHGINERYAFTLCIRARATVRYRGVDQELHDEMLVVREPGEAYYTSSVSKPFELKVLFVDAGLVGDAARELVDHDRLYFAPVPIKSDPALFSLLCRLCSAMEKGSEALEQHSLLAAALVGLARHAERPPRPSALKNGKLAVARAKAYLREHYSDPVTLHELARICGMTRFSLVHAFTKEVGLSPHAYQLHLRIGRARTLLQQGVGPTNVAMMMGFADQSHFTRHFKRIMQLTPSQYAGHSFAAHARSGPRPSLVTAVA